MPCYHPLAAFRVHGQTDVQVYKRGEKLWNEKGEHLELACGRCAGCRVRRSLEWAMRCMHEAQMHRYNAYITLTYDEENLPPDRNLSPRDYALFMKKIRNLVRRAADLVNDKPRKRKPQKRVLQKVGQLMFDATDPGIRFYLGGEYGPKHGRPHYHAILFGLNFNDQIPAGRSEAGEKFYESKTLTELWGKGKATIQEVNFNTASYIAKYVMKKRLGDEDKFTYQILDPETGEIHIRKKEYNAMSKKHAIGHTWWHKYKTDVFTTDKVITKNGRQLTPPRYYDKLLKKHHEEIYLATKLQRQATARASAAEHTDERLAIKEAIYNHDTRHHRRNVE